MKTGYMKCNSNCCSLERQTLNCVVDSNIIKYLNTHTHPTTYAFHVLAPYYRITAVVRTLQIHGPPSGLALY